MIHGHIELLLLLIILQVTFVISIIQGSPCQSNQSFNHIALIRTRHHHCTGTLIRSDWIITSASCFTTDETKVPRPEHVFVQAGTLVDYVSEMSGRLTDDIKNFKARRQKRFADFIDAVEFEKISGALSKTTKPGTNASTAFTSPKNSKNPTTRKTKKPFNIRFLHLSYDHEAKTKKYQDKLTDGTVLFSHTALVKLNMSKVSNINVKVPANDTTEVSKFVRNVLEIHLCPSYNLESSLLKQCDLALLKLDRPFRRSDRISWLPVGNGGPTETPFHTHLCGWGQRESNESVDDQASSQEVVKNFALDVQILPPAHCPPSRKETRGIYCLMTSSRDHPCIGDEGLPLVIKTGIERRLLAVGHGSEPIVVYRRRRKEGGRYDGNQGQGSDRSGSNEEWSNERRNYGFDSGIHSCGSSDRYYIFTNLCYHLDWIHQVIPELFRRRNMCH